MKDTPKVGTRVKSTNFECCEGHGTGVIGFVIDVFDSDNIRVKTPDGMEFLHCRRCLEEVK